MVKRGGGRMALKPVDMSRFRVLDLSQNFSVDSPPFAFYEGPTIKWVKKMAFEGVNAQLISSTNHIATHLDSPLHFNDPGPDVAGIPLEELLGPACIVDLAQFGVGLRCLRAEALRDVGAQIQDPNPAGGYPRHPHRVPSLLQRGLVQGAQQREAEPPPGFSQAPRPAARVLRLGAGAGDPVAGDRRDLDRSSI